MLEKLKDTFKQTAIYSIGNLSTKLIGFLLLPIYTSKLTTGDYGILAYMEATSLLIIAVLNLGLPTGILRYCSSDNKKNDKEIIFTVFCFSFFISLLILAPLFVFRLHVSEILLNSRDYILLINLLLVIIPIEVFNNLTLSVIRLREKSGLYVFLIITKFTLSLILNIYFIIGRHMKVDGIMLSQLLSGMVLIFLSLGFLLRNIKFRFQLEILKDMLRYSFPLIFTTLSSMALTMSDRYIIEYFINFSELGVYSLGVKFAGLINVFILQSFQLGYLPIAFKIYNQPEAKQFFTKVMTYLVLVLIIASLAVSLFSKEVIVVMARKNPDFWRAFVLIPILCMGHVFRGIQYLFSLSLHYVKKTHINAFIVLSTALFNIGMNLIIVKIVGIFGAALSNLFAYMVGSGIYYYYSQKYYRIRYEWVRIIMIIATGLVLFFVSYYFFGKLSYANFFVKILLLFVYPVILYLLGFYHKVEIERIRQFWAKWKKISNLKGNIMSLSKTNETLLEN
jgi:O-antigen/teichoic acid export membrane protein